MGCQFLLDVYGEDPDLRAERVRSKIFESIILKSSIDVARPTWPYYARIKLSFRSFRRRC
jgi:hypothetical protein